MGETMSDHFCITNSELWQNVHPVDRPFPCRRRGVHYATCPNLNGDDPDGCRGCVEREATVGFLCPSCWSKTEDALSRVGNLIAHLRSIEKPGQALGERVNTSMERSILMPDTWIAADSLLDALGSPPVRAALDVLTDIGELNEHIDRALQPWSDPVDVVNGREGAKRAVVLIRRMQTALRRWPDSEAEYRHVPYVLCPECHQKHLWRRAPLEYLDEVLIECGTGGCTYKRDWFEWQEAYAPILEGIFKEQDRIRKQQKRKNQ